MNEYLQALTYFLMAAVVFAVIALAAFAVLDLISNFKIDKENDDDYF